MGFTDYPEIDLWPGVTAYVGTNTLAGWKDSYFNIDADAYASHGATINAAISYVNGLGGGTVELEEGTYTLAAGDVLALEDDVWLKGQGPESFIDGDALLTTEHAISISGKTNCRVSDLSIQTQDGGGKTCHCIFIEDGSDRFVIDGVTIVESDANGIHVEGTTTEHGWITRCIFVDTDDVSISIDMDAGNYARYFHITNNAIYGSGYGISVAVCSGNENFIIADNFVDAGTEAISLHSFDYGAITNNIVYGAGNDGLHLNQATYSTIDGNIFSFNVQHGIYIQDSDQCVISNNICAENDSGDSATYDGINLDGSSTDNVVSGNSCYGNHRYGISSTGTRNTISGNSIVANDRDGINIGAASHIVSDNYCLNNGQDAAGTYDAISTDGTADLSMFINNYCHDSGGNIQEHGISIGDGSSSVLISGNYCYNGMGSGIVLVANIDNAAIIGNYCSTNDDYGIQIAAGTCDNTAVHNNYLVSNVTSQLTDSGTTTDKKWNWCGGPVYNSNGCGFATIAASVSDLTAGGWVKVPTGTWDERVTLAVSEVMLIGEGWDTIINETSDTGHAITISGNNVIVRDLQCETTGGGLNAYDAIYVSGTDALIENVYIPDSDQHGIQVTTRGRVKDCRIDGVDLDALTAYGADCSLINNKINIAGRYGIVISATGDGTVVSGNNIDTTADDGIDVHDDAENCVVTGNRIINWTNEPIDDDSATSLVADNWAGGTVMTSKGCSMATIALALTYVGASGWVEVPSGTWDERVTMSNADVTLRGQGWDTIINQTTENGHSIDISANNCVVRDLQCGTAPAGTNNYDGIVVNGVTDAYIVNVFVNGSDRFGINIAGARSRVTDCYIYNTDDQGIRVSGNGDDSIIKGNQIDTTGDDGMSIESGGDNVIVSGNRISGWTNESIDDDSNTATITGNNVVV